MLYDPGIADGIVSKSFRGANGGTEHFIFIEAPGHGSFGQQLASIEKCYEKALGSLSLSPDTAVFRRIFLSDVLNQSSQLRDSPLVKDQPGNPVAVSIVQQHPLNGSKIAFMAYHIDGPGPLKKRRIASGHMLVNRHGQKHVWSTQLCAQANAATSPEEVHTRGIFDNLLDMLARQGGSLKDNCVRTWLYLKDVDVFYRGMVSSRRELFNQHGLTEDTHYIASTGIEGCCSHQFDLVMMDAYSILGLLPEQMSFLNDFDRLCATKDYNVTFERGTKIAYADRSHYFISGTASIDHAGRVVHPGDVIRQLNCALDNVDALLCSGSATLADMMYLLVYLRDPADFGYVSAELKNRLPDLPAVIVKGSVCRPEWLVEVEGVAITANNSSTLPDF